MKLMELFVQGFGRFGTQRTLNFKNGVNVVIGPNESGKSTLHNAILASLFQPGKEELDSYCSWSDPDVCKVKLTYQTSNGDVYRISRDLKSKKVVVEKQVGTDFTEVARTEKAAKNIISEHIGFHEKRVFENTVCVTQGEMAALKDKAAIKQIKDIISNLITGTKDTSANKAIETLDKKIKEIDGGPRTNGRLDEINSEIKNNNSSLEEAKIKEKSALDLKEEQKAIEEKIVSKESHFKKYESIKIKYDAIKKLQDENSNKKEVLQNLMNIIQKVKDINREIGGIEEELERLSAYENLSNETISDLRSLENKKNELQTGINTIKEKLNKEIDDLNSSKPNRSNYLLYAGIIIFLISAGGLFLINSLFITGILIGIILIVYHIIRSKSGNVIAIQTRIEQFGSDIHEKESSIENISKQIESYYLTLPARNTKELSEKLDIYLRKGQKRANLTSQKEILLGNNKLNELEQKKDDLLIGMGKNDKRLEELGDLNLSAEEQILLQGLSGLKNEIDELKQLKQNIIGKLSNMDIENPSIELEEGIEYKKEQLNRLQERSIALKIARDLLQDVSTEIQKQMAPELEDKANNILKDITNKYSEIYIDQNFDIRVMSPEKKEIIAPDFLSSGAKDQLYFALRVATSDALSKSVNPPLILDEPFGSFDSVRRDLTISLLKKLSKTCQIILMTHDDYYRTNVDNIIELN
ncbi:MAG: AAA family ATPase [Euryarchaeota archaeon]|nr:AAA family ATPase [Euryarchaeota archaeon]